MSDSSGARGQLWTWDREGPTLLTQLWILPLRLTVGPPALQMPEVIKSFTCRLVPPPTLVNSLSPPFTGFPNVWMPSHYSQIIPMSSASCLSDHHIPEEPWMLDPPRHSAPDPSTPRSSLVEAVIATLVCWGFCNKAPETRWLKA